MELGNEFNYLLAFLTALFISVITLFMLLKKHKKQDLPEDPEMVFERKKFTYALFLPSVFIFLLWFVKLAETGLDADFGFLGIYPREFKGLPGILTAALIHDDFRHLTDNSIPTFILSLTLFYFYREIALKIFLTVYFITGSLVWIFGRDAYHIGASGLVYGFASFIFFSGVIRKNVNLLSISLMVIFLYGSLVWGILPFDYKISWESHLLGGITGAVLSVIYKDMGPQRKIYSWELEDEEEGATGN